MNRVCLEKLSHGNRQRWTRDTDTSEKTCGCNSQSYGSNWMLIWTRGRPKVCWFPTCDKTCSLEQRNCAQKWQPDWNGSLVCSDCLTFVQRLRIMWAIVLRSQGTKLLPETVSHTKIWCWAYSGHVIQASDLNWFDWSFCNINGIPIEHGVPSNRPNARHWTPDSPRASPRLFSHWKNFIEQLKLLLNPECWLKVGEGPVCWDSTRQHVTRLQFGSQLCRERQPLWNSHDSWWPEFDMFGSMPSCSFPRQKLLPKLAQKNCHTTVWI